MRNRVLLVVPVLVGCLILPRSAGQEKSAIPRVIEAEQFVIVGKDQKPVARICAMPENWPGINICFGTKAILSIQCFDEKGAILTMHSPRGGTQAGVLLDETQAVLEMDRGTRKTCQAAIGFRPDGEPFVKLVNDLGKSVSPKAIQEP